MRKAFTLVELIVVITILAILGTIAFISLQGYSKDARDVKRISDVRSLLTKLNVEQSLGTSPEELITNTTPREGRILGIEDTPFNTMGEVDFETINEKEGDFQDPVSNTNYPVAYAIGGTGTGVYNFIQIATITETANITKILGNYYTKETDDIPSLFTRDGENYYQENGTPIYDITDGTTQLPPLENGVFEGSETQTGQLTDGSNFTWKDITLTYNGTSYTLMDRNLGATVPYTSGDTESTANTIGSLPFYGNYYQWGRNDTGWTNGSSSNNSDWQTRNDNAWGDNGGNGTSLERQGPCPEDYHVPSTLEWDGLFQTWCKSRGGNDTLCNIPVLGNKTWNTLSSGTDATLDNFKTDLKIPLAGFRSWDNGNVRTQGSRGGYWSSSPNGTSVHRLDFNLSHVYPQYDNARAHGFSVRCFKN